MIARLFSALALIVLVSVSAAFRAPDPGPDPVSGTLPGRAAAEAFEVDMAHSTLIYRIRHFGVSWFYGRIKKPAGSFLIDETDLASSFVTITLEMKNMDAGNRSRDQFLLSPDFFNVREHPTAEFKSTSVTKTGDGTFEATGTFTMHGVTKTITVPLVDYAEKTWDRFGPRAGFECTFTVKRGDYGMTKMLDDESLGNDVRITASIEGVRR